MRGQAEVDRRNPPTNDRVTEELEMSGFEPVSENDYSPVSNVDELFVRVDGDTRPFVKVSVLGREIIGLLDSGAHRSVLGAGCRKLIKLLRLKMFPSDTHVQTASGSTVDVEGFVYLPVTFNNENRIIKTLVAPKLKRRLILGFDDFWRAFQIQPVVLSRESRKKEKEFEESLRVEELEWKEGGVKEETLSETQKAQLEKVKLKFKIAIEGQVLDVTPLATHRIELKDEFKNSPPIRINPYPTSPEMQKRINKELDNMLQQQVIEHSKSEWSQSTVPVIKPTGEVRLCLDARRLNDRTKRDAYPLPHQDRILSRLGASKYLTTIDLTKAFLQIPLHPDSRKYTAFSVLGRGLFQFTRLPFGLVNSPLH